MQSLIFSLICVSPISAYIRFPHNSLKHRTNTLIQMSEKSNNNASITAYLDRFDDWADKQSKSTGIIPSGKETLEAIKNTEKRKSDPSKMNPTKYFKMVEKLSPNEVLLKFATTAPKNVQEAAKTTIMNLLGSLPNYALDAALVTTNSRLANLLYQMQMTGYMFKNAEYRMSLTKALKGLPTLPPPSSIKTENSTLTPSSDISKVLSSNTTVSVRTTTGENIEVEVSQLTDALSKEVANLRAELSLIKNSREKELKENLLTYVQALPEKELSKLTSDMSEEVIVTIRMLVDAMMSRIGVNPEGPEVMIQQSIGQLAQLCMWQMVLGYKLRELEVLEKGASFD